MNRGGSRRGFLALAGQIALGAAVGACRTEPLRKEERSMIDVDEMVYVPAGTFVMGTGEQELDTICDEFGIDRSWLVSETPKRDIHVNEFLIDKYPVTRAQYAGFVRATGYPAPVAPRLEEPEDSSMHPVVGVRWADAKAYAEWAGKRLPTEAEWEKAARGTDGRTWPWGNEWNPRALNWNSGERKDARMTCTRPVYAYPSGVGPYGVWDMCGNAAEWTGEGYLGSEHGLIKSGGWIVSQPYNLRPAFHGFSQWAHNANAYTGFRCAK